MLGKQLNSSEFQKFIIEFKQQDINWIIADNNRNSLGVYMPNKNLTFTLEELVAMILMDARAMAEKMAQEKVTDCVITVSPEFDAFQRMALKDAVEISGLRALSFINENMAASIRYSIDGHIATNDSLVMYINMGAASFKATLIKHTRGTNTETKKPFEKLEILGEAWDKTLGGRQFDYEMVELLADKFNELPARKGKPDIRENPKAMRRILAAAEDYKVKLTAAKFLKIYIDSLADYVNLVGEITREEYEPRLEKYKPRILNVINEVFRDAGKNITDVDSVELIGSGLRIPLIMDFITEAFNGTKPNQRLNQEEAISFGSGFLAASLSPSFKVKQIIAMQSCNYEIYMDIKNVYNTTCTDDIKLECSKKPYNVSTVIMKKRSEYDTGKLVKIPFTSDFDIAVYENHSDIGEEPSPKLLFKYKIRGVNELARNLTKKFKVELKFEADEYGIVDLVFAKVLNTKVVSGSGTNDTEEHTKKIEEEFPLECIKESVYPLPMTPEQIQESRKRIQKIVDSEQEELERSKEKNNFESAIYGIRDWVNDENNERFIETDLKVKLINLLADVNILFIIRKRIGSIKLVMI